MRDWLAPLLSVAVVGALSLGCTTSLTTLTPAQTTPGGHVRMSGAVAINAPVGKLLDDVLEAKDRVSAIEDGEMATPDDVKLISETAVAVVATPPTAMADIAGRVGLTDRFDLGFRYSGGSLRGDVRFQFLGSTEDDDTFFGSVGLGAGLFVFGSKLPVPAEYEEVLEIENNGQYQLDASVLFGPSGRFGHLWLGPKFVMSSYDTDARITLSGVPEQHLSITGTNLYYGGQVGFALGFQFIWVMFELTVVGVSTNTDADAGAAGAFLGDLGGKSTGLIIYPAGGLLLQF